MSQRNAALADQVTNYFVGILGCWIWKGFVLANGYGQMPSRNNEYGERLAHRASYRFHVGPIPDDLEIDHLCRVKCCVNPAHLEPVTHGENLRRGHASRKLERQTAALRMPPRNSLSRTAFIPRSEVSPYATGGRRGLYNQVAEVLPDADSDIPMIVLAGMAG